MNKKERQAEEILNSFEGMQRAEPGPFLYGRILSRVTNKSGFRLSPYAAWAAAAVFAGLLIINIAIFRAASRRTTEISMIADAYHLRDTNTLSYR